ncbi:hypothetical protein GCK72_018169 [Caenorhabditis remanei]|uniref:Uncharacterized protein n=1 Tax=Caenorhabditis remanei TaxID=31234 RepID=A0A6A5GAN5_CAERE|nr:hypothetical protein GCK72_018166 [Caenorhabditis remanei]XP_053581343.1 hypothetical protein GCK72_018169 [Caenorhabditis remanei]KAF1751612.1 hypothetical protein GCK72_018166 [Caenorhabditis remanei]KAF1751615.1 hypothetical protein GCK72_018169 [Caenorhabditis remanei]
MVLTVTQNVIRDLLRHSDFLMPSKLSGKRGKRCNCMDPLRDVRSKYTSQCKIFCTFREIRYRGGLGIRCELLQDLEAIRFIIDDQLGEDEAIFHFRDGRILEYSDVIAKCPSEVPSIQDGVNLLEFYNNKLKKNITDEQFVLMDKQGRYHPISELFIAKVPTPCSSCQNLPQSPSTNSPKLNEDTQKV